MLSKGKVVAQGTSAELKANLGQRMITARLDDHRKSDVALTAIRRLGFTPTYSAEQHAVTIPGVGTKDLARVVRALDEDHIELAELVLTEPSLDDVYLAVTDKKPATAA
ncbi:hypothetical protein ACFQ1S_11685 [Kibdelosporangium lantanae]|uniref:DUF4162 domain-containing protein n=1 Tax=Kibdelosporangium lantanae TaxID=1497396 RepID=A0ABW3M7U3_9PSEU